MSHAGLSTSRFYMWRAIIAMVHADGIVTPQEIDFVQSHTKHVPMSESQQQVLLGDLREPRDVFTMFSQVTHAQDKRDFFALARALSWSDGDYDAQEAHILNVLEKMHMDDENKKLLKESRDVMQEVELGDDQWDYKTPQSKNLFGFLNALVTAN